MGNQVADNTEMQYTSTIKVSDEGNFYVETSDVASRGLVKENYLPVGKSLVYPSKWGKKKGILHLIDHFIDEQERIVEKAERDLRKLNKLREAFEQVRNI